jgi:transcriptional regulator with XRE-family HTH domain
MSVTILDTMETKLGEILRKNRKAAKLSQSRLAQLSGVSRAYIILIESGKRGEHISAKILIQLASALGTSPKPFLESIGLKYEEPNFPESARLPVPDRHPIYKDFPFHAGSPVRPVDYYYRTWPGKAPKNIEGYIVHGTCLEPDVKEGDVIIVDRDGAIDNGDLIACLMGEELHLGRIRKIAGELWLENNVGRHPFKECFVAAPVIEINRRVK